MKYKMIKIHIVIIFLLLISCSKELLWNNAYDTIDQNSWAPSDLTVSQISANKVQISWKDNAQNEQGYNISRKVGSGAWIENIATVGENITQWTDTNAPIGSTYTYKVKAYAGSNVSNGVEKIHTILFLAPTNLSIVPVSLSSLKLTWQDINQFEQGFKISRKVGAGAWEENIATVGENITQWTDTNAPIGNTYSYKVKVFASNNISSGIEESYVFQLSAPTNLSINPLSATSLKLTWQDNNQFEQGFKISRKVGAGVWEENIATVGENITQWTDTNAPIGSTYTYKVKAYAGSNASNGVENTFTIQLSAPTNLTINPLSATSLKLTWQDSNQLEQGFKISRKVGSGAWEENIASVGENITQWTDTNAPIGSTYTYKVKAYAGSNASNGVENTFTFQLSAPTNLTINPLSATSLKLTWQDSNQFEQGFKISRKVGAGAWEENIATVGENITQWTDSSVDINIQSYEYKIRAYYQNSYSNTSIIVGNYPSVSTPTFNPPSGTYSSAQNVIISCTTSGAQIRYTTDGSNPTSASVLYSSPISIYTSTTLKAKAFKFGYLESNIVNATYNINLPAINLMFPIGGEVFHKDQTYTIRWTTNSSNIQNVSIHLYKGSILWQSINNSTSNTGTYQWTVFWQIQTGDDYFIKIRNADAIGYPNEIDESGYFSIVP